MFGVSDQNFNLHAEDQIIEYYNMRKDSIQPISIHIELEPCGRCKPKLIQTFGQDFYDHHITWEWNDNATKKDEIRRFQEPWVKGKTIPAYCSQKHKDY